MVEGLEMKALAEELCKKGVHRDTFLGVILETQSEESAAELRKWLIENPKMSQRRIIQKAMIINRGAFPIF